MNFEQKRLRGRPRREDAPDPQAMVDAALSVFARHGWNGANMREIAELAHVDAALIARRFEGKMGLWMAAVDNVSAALITVLDTAGLEGLDVRKRLAVVVSRFVDLHLDRPDLGRFFIDETARPGIRRDYIIDQLWNVHRAGLLPLLEEARGAGAIPTGTDPEMLLSVLIGAVATPLLMRSIALDDVESGEGRAAFKRNILATFGLV